MVMLRVPMKRMPELINCRTNVAANKLVSMLNRQLLKVTGNRHMSWMLNQRGQTILKRWVRVHMRDQKPIKIILNSYSMIASFRLRVIFQAGMPIVMPRGLLLAKKTRVHLAMLA